jgi:hypothetical protein
MTQPLDQLIKALYQSLLQSGDLSHRWSPLFERLRASDQATIIQVVIRDIEVTYFLKSVGLIDMESRDQRIVGSVASLLDIMLQNNHTLLLQVQSWLSLGQGGFIQSIEVRRAFVLLLSKKEGR